MTVDLTPLLGRRYRVPEPPTELARRVAHVISISDRVGMGFMYEVGDPVGNCRDVPGAEETFGLATLTAACERMTGCRWCYAAALATRHRWPAPLYTPAVRLLLGDRVCSWARHRDLRPRLVTAPPTAARPTQPREVSLAFTASAARRPTRVEPLRPTAATLARMRRNGVDPRTYFGESFTTVEDDARLGALVRRTYPGRR